MQVRSRSPSEWSCGDVKEVQGMEEEPDKENMTRRAAGGKGSCCPSGIWRKAVQYGREKENR